MVFLIIAGFFTIILDSLIQLIQITLINIHLTVTATVLSLQFDAYEMMNKLC